METKEIRAAKKFLAFHGHVKRCALPVAPLPRFVEDIVQQVFVEFISKVDRWDIETDIKPLLTRTTYQVARKYWRDHLKTLPSNLARLAERLRIPEFAEPENEPVSDQRYEEEIAALWTCLDKLPPKSRDLIHSYYFKEETTRTLAARLNVQVESVNRTICRIRMKLRECILRNIPKEDADAR